MFWSINGDHLTNAIIKSELTGSAVVQSNNESEFRFGGEAVTLLQGASAIAGLTSSLILIFNAFAKPNDAGQKWTSAQIADQLKNSGVATDKIAKILEIAGNSFK